MLATALMLAQPTHATPPRGPTLTVVGDVNFAGYPDTLTPFRAVAPLLASDLRIANAEGLLTDLPVTAYRESRLDITAPASFARHFRAFDLVGLANNHTWDGGTPGLLSHLDAFAKHSLPTYGAALTRETAYAAARYRWNGATLTADNRATAPCVSVLGATLKSNRTPKANQQGAHAALATTDATRAEVLAKVGAEHANGCFVLVSLHGGREGASHPDPKTRAFGLALLDAGADLVAAHHPHVLQGVELRRPAPGSPAEPGARQQAIAWSLGNFVFRNRTPEKRQTAILHATLRQDGSRLTLEHLALLPVHSDRELLPRPATRPEAAAITRLVAERSARFGTTVTLDVEGRITLH